MKTLQFLIITLLTTICFAQEDDQKKENNRKFSISFELADYNQQIKENDDHLTNASGLNRGLKLGYQLSEDIALKTGFQYISDISFAGLTFISIKFLCF